MYKVLVIEGPTAIGKTSFSIDVAKKFNGEIISGDSVQIYRDFNIGSGKIKDNEKDGIIHHLIDIKDFDEDYSIMNFQSDVRKLIEDISFRNKLAIIVGGSGLYLKSALYDYTFDVEEEKDNPYEELSNEDLYNKLLEVDPKCLEKIHINNRRRLLRAYNYFIKNNKKISENVESQNHIPLYDVLFVGLTCERKKLYERINMRVDKMFQDGLKEEVISLLDKGATFNDKPMQAIGYRQWKEYFSNHKDVDSIKEDIKKASRNFAKRQYTWFNNQTPITWYDIDELDKAKKDIEVWFYE